MDKEMKLAFAKRVREISVDCFDLGAAERLRLLAEEIERVERDSDRDEGIKADDKGRM
jgi:hypothetical protein